MLVTIRGHGVKKKELLSWGGGGVTAQIILQESCHIHEQKSQKLRNLHLTFWSQTQIPP